jgi:ribonucleoside-diphosphate reductase alpha chain
MISLSDLGSEQLAKAKSGRWYDNHVYRQLANNSAVYDQRPMVGEFLKEWRDIHDSYSGERGIFNRDASRRIVERSGRRDPNHEFGTNPCSEIILRPFQFCNLTSVVVRAGDGFDDLARKVRLAAILGTIQSTFTDFKYLRKIWKRNTEEERLLGVSLSGLADNPEVYNNEGELFRRLKQIAVDTNAEWADRLGIPRSAAITCNKPEGTASQLVNSASGIHKRHARTYIRTIRNDVKDPISQFLIDQGVPYELDQRNASSYVFSFPQKAPDECIVREDTSAIEELEFWKRLQEHWCEHKPSATINVPDDQWVDVAAWVYRNFDILSGVSFLPFDPTEYPQAPYQTVTEDQYNQFLEKMPREINWEKLAEYEKEDMTTGSQELACVAGICEI